MIEIPEMSYAEKLEDIQQMQRLVETFAPKLARGDFGDEKAKELRKIWAEESIQIPPEATDEESYEIAYRNLLQNWMSGKNFMQKYGGGLAVRNYVKAATKAYKDQYSNYALPIKVIGRVSPKTAFKMLAKRLAYQLQMFSPFTIIELTDERMVLKMSPCKIVKTRGSNDFCLMACQNIIPSWLEASYNMRMVFSPNNENCTATITPFT